MKKTIYHETASHYSDMLSNIRNEILKQISAALEWLGGKVCLGYYHDEAEVERYTFYETDDDGYGQELFVDSIKATENGEIEIRLSDSEDCYCPTWDSSDLTATDAVNLLTELEGVMKYIQEKNTEVVTEYPL